VTNVWWRRGRRLYTPALELGILAGVTRAALLEVAAQRRVAVEEGAFRLADLYAADEAFTSSSVREIMPLVEIDGRALARGPLADELQRELRELAGGP
jgi:branched-subunit amino acid aminotransferase/4-amino-4-deoxychorismate lyase